MDTIRWSHPDGDFTISNSGGRLLIGIEPKPDGGWYSIWADWGWEGPELGLHEPLEWEDEHGNRARAAFGLGNAAVRISIRPEGDDGSLDDAPSVLLDREHWIEAVHALLQPARGEFWAEVAAAQPPEEPLPGEDDEDDENDEELPEVRWTGDGGDFVITNHTSDLLLSIETDDDTISVWAPEWDLATLAALDEPVTWEDDDGWRAQIAKLAPRSRLRRPEVQIGFGFEHEAPTQVTLSHKQWKGVVEVLAEPLDSDYWDISD
ncbi:hypothetical protein DVA67_006060 [Solirubrobacter sp. CPCC 204708]|uniref:Uncharacterized protein n=1 Tax=Solirubrobacter deserti TaxID=2282478 RepID=A0ABT4RCA2_9ACTN|nr:hypothetical protein [Solirubrobacter deserti]MBE2315531.1 hypothetical protein [Solirubrobacter deserti]MDA0136170.1 hypothetical protein [Solirubrobacter deserti]